MTDSIGRLQFSDITSQRIEHVKKALEVLQGVLENENDDDRESLVAAVCRLQQAQLERTALDYRQHVEALIANLGDIEKAVEGILAESEAAFSAGSDGRQSFAGELEADLERATRLMAEFVDAHGRAQTVMESVRASVAGIIEDLGRIGSIDADMQVMGLNATLKCGRLGAEGRALAVIAQELRTCSKRTQDQSGAVAGLLHEITGISDRLRASTGQDGKASVAEVNTALSRSLAHLDALARLLDVALESLHAEGGKAAGRLRETRCGIHIHEEMERALLGVARRMESLAGPEGAGAGDVEAVREKVRDLLSAHYTMASERLLHSFILDEEAETSETAAPESGGIDDCFL